MVQARGPNNLPSEACIAKTGRKLTMVVATAVSTAVATSLVASYMTSSIRLPRTPLFLSSSRCRIMFSVNTIPTSTMTPMAMAIPDRATILASIEKNFIRMKVISTPMGRRLEIRKEALRFITSTITTRMLIKISWDRADSSVPSVSRISPDRS